MKMKFNEHGRKITPGGSPIPPLADRLYNKALASSTIHTWIFKRTIEAAKSINR